MLYPMLSQAYTHIDGHILKPEIIVHACSFIDCFYCFTMNFSNIHCLVQNIYGYIVFYCMNIL